MSAAYFSGRLRELRESAGLSQAQLAERIGTTVRNISRLETGVQEPTWPTVLALAEVLGVDCLAFTQAPAGQSGPRRGRPRKDAGERTVLKPKPSRKRSARVE